MSPRSMLQNGEHMLELAAAALDFYNAAFGPYPFRELDFVEVPLSLAYGVSWSGILFINESQLALSPEKPRLARFHDPA